MNAEVFVDTNVLLYSIDDDRARAPKRQRAQQLLLSERWGWSVQVAAEFFVNGRLGATSPGLFGCLLDRLLMTSPTPPPARAPRRQLVLLTR
jgi:hypothetical protein